LAQHLVHRSRGEVAAHGRDDAEAATVVAVFGNLQVGVVLRSELEAIVREQVDEGVVPGRHRRVHGLHDAAVVLRSADREHARVRLPDHFLALAEAAGDDHLAVLGHRLADRVQRLGHRRVDEAAGVDHHYVRGLVAGHQFVAFDPQLGEDALGVHQRLGAAEADESDFGGGGHREESAGGEAAAYCSDGWNGGLNMSIWAGQSESGGQMGRDIALDTPSGKVGAWRADPLGAPRGGIVVVQEIFGVNAYVRAVADRYAAEGYVALAPAFFDLVERGVELGYDQAQFARGRELAQAVGLERAAGVAG